MNIYAPKKPKRINSVSVTIALVLLVVGYLGWAFGPILWSVFQLEGIARAACNDAYRQLDDDAVIERLVRDSARTGLRLTKENFRLTRLPYDPAELEEQTATIKDSRRRADQVMFLKQRGKTCVIEYYYRDRYPLPLIGQSIELTFNDEVRGSLETVTW